MKLVTPSWTRILIAAAIALAVPLQGVAAASAGVCMALGHHQAPATDEHAGHDHGMDHGQEAADDADADAAHCAPCVACCAAAAISPSNPVVLASTVPLAALALAPPQIAGAQLALLDRPPLAL
jgi:hypothetical protein